MLLYTLPKVAERLGADCADAREATLTLLGRLFADADADYAAHYPQVYAEWLRRFTDKDANIRTKMVHVALSVVRDRGASRRAATRAIADAVLDAAPDGLDDARGGADWDACVAGLRARVRDKRPEIRKESLTGLATLFRAHVSKRWEVDDDDDGEDADDDALTFSQTSKRRKTTCARAALASAARAGAAGRLGWVPALLLQSFAAACNAGDVSERARLLLDEHVYAVRRRRATQLYFNTPWIRPSSEVGETPACGT